MFEVNNKDTRTTPMAFAARFQSVSDHFGTLCIKWLKVVSATFLLDCFLRLKESM